MKISIQGRIVDTQNISDIVPIKCHHKDFYPITAGFTIFLMDNTSLEFKEMVSNRVDPYVIVLSIEKWNALYEKVVEAWNSDKTEVLKLDL